ncbi:hypothetical protein J3P75_18610 [Pseudomonas sp. R1-1]|uniref:hypothetical protein n=1 Tax=Pseudomonas sp. R1-1 TaxID=1602529 RepID=UPI003DA90A3B
MEIWDGENIMNVLQLEKVTIIEPGPLLSPVLNFRIFRNHSLQLKLETCTATKPHSREHVGNPGNIYINDSTISLGGTDGGKGSISGITPLLERSDGSESIETSAINYITYQTQDERNTTITFEWLGNFPDGSFIWPTNTVTKNGEKVIFGDPPIRLKSHSTNYSLQRNGIRLSLGGYDVYVSSCDSRCETTETLFGSIMIVGAPADDTRDKIRNCISFAFGMPLISLGCSRFDERGDLVSLKAVNPSSLDGRAWRLFPLPSAPITVHGSNVLDPDAVEKLANAAYEIYDTYNLRTIFWRYWHSAVAPMFMAPAYYGAIIESIQTKFLKIQREKLDRGIINRKSFRELRAIVNTATKDIVMSEECRKLFATKLDDANRVPQKIVTQRFFDALQLEMGDHELTAWARRNDAAHGKDVPNDDHISLLRETRILKIMLHRTLLKIMGGSETYIDYNSPFYPKRPLNISSESGC